MKVIVKVSGFYAGTWYDASQKEVEMLDRVAKPFLPPYGEQLAVAPEPKPAKVEKAADKKAS